MGWLTALLWLWGASAVAQITVPTANTNSGSARHPLTTWYGYSRSAMLYKASEISASGTITSLGFYLNSRSTPGAAPTVIYLKTTSATSLTSSTVAAEEAGATQVYNATIPAASFVAGTWITIPLTTSFAYNGTSNLEVIVETNATGGGNEGSTAKQFRYTTVSGGMQTWDQDTSPPTGSGSVSSSRPNIQLTGLTPLPCVAPSSLSVGSITTTSASVSFTAGNGNTSYTVTYTPQGGSATTITPAPTASPVALTGLTPSTQYTVSVTGNCSGGQTSPAATTTFTTLAPPPANDECASATPITSIGVGTCGTAVTGTNVGATTSSTTGTPAPGCASYAGGDVWFSLTVPANGIVQVSTDQGSGTSISDTGLALYSGACGSLTLISCDDDSGPDAFSLIRATGLTPGATIYARVWEYGNDAFGSFAICAQTDPACAPPTALTAGSVTSTSASVSFTAGNGNTSYTVTYTPQGGSATTITPAPTASPVALTGLTPSTQYTVSVTGNCSGGQTSTAATTTFTTPAPPPANDECASATPITSIGVGTCGTAVTGTNVGATTSSTTGTPAPGCASYAGGDVWFRLTVPANGIVQVSTDQGSGSNVADTGLALYSGACGSLTLISCDDDSGPNAFSLIRATGLTPGATIYARVWEYGNDAFGSFAICAQTDAACAPPTALAADSVNSTSASVRFTAGNGNTSYTVTYTPQGGSATTITPAPTASPVRLTGLTPSTQYTVSVTGNCAGGQTSTAATTTFTTLAPPPANDECASATPITSIGVGTCGTAVTGTNVGATTSSTTGTPAPGCASYAGGDVWFRLTVPANGIVQVSTDQGSGSNVADTGLALYSGACGSLTLISCDDDSGPNAFSLIRATGLTPGATIYARVWEYGNDAFGTFSICAQTDAACAPPTALTAGSITSTSASVSFTPGNGNTSYVVTYTPQGGSATTITPAPTTSPVALTGLTPSTQYTVSVTGNCAGGQTSPAATTTFTTLAPPPANDECAAAIGLTSATTCTATTGSTLGATASTATGTCAGTADDDVWYSFVASGTTHTITVVGNSGFDAVVNLRASGCPGTTLGSCADVTGNGGTETITATSLTPGATYYVRVFSYSSTAPSNAATGGFTICVTNPAACAAPTALTAGSVTSTSASLSFTPGNGNTSYVVTYTPQGGSATTVTPAPTASPVSLTGLTPNTQYTVSVTGNCAGGQTSATAATTTFTTRFTPPANDECAAAIGLTSATTCTATTGSTLGATASTATGTCAGTADDDVWYSFVASGTTHTITVVGNSGFDAVVNLRASGCPGTTLGSCADVTGNGGTETITATSLTPGATYYVRVFSYSSTAPINAATGGFTICVTTPLTDLTVNSAQGVQGSYNNVTITSGGTANLTGPLTVSGTLTVQDGGILATNCQPVTGAGSFVLQAGGQLRICDAAGISPTGASGAIQLTGTRSYSNDASYAYNGSTTGQVTGPGLPGRARALFVLNSNGLTLGGPLQLAQGLVLSGNLTTNGNNLTLLSSANGTATVVNRSGVVNGTVTVQRYIDPTLNPGAGYRHYSAPVSNTTVADLATSGFTPTVNQAYNTSTTPNLVTPFPTVFSYEESRVQNGPVSSYSLFDRGWASPAALSDPLTPGRGYTVNIGASQLVDFVGTLNNGPVNRLLVRVAGTMGGYHLVGNPYPAPIDWSKLSLPVGLEDAMYVYQSTSQYGGVYRSYVNGFGNPRIASGQGFFVHMTPSGATTPLTFTNALRDTSFVAAPSFNRGVETRPAVQLNLIRPGAPVADEAYVYFENGATVGVDSRYDALKMQHNSGGMPSVYALTAGAELSINGLPELTARTVVPLGIDVPQAGSYIFEAAQLLNLTTARVYLHDVQTGQYHDLHQQPRYGFTAATAGAQNARFELVFEPQRPTASAPGLTAASVSLYPNPAHGSFALLVPAVPGATQVQATLLNSLGQEVRRQTKALPASGARLDVDVTGLATGVYTVRLQAGSAQIIKRVVIE